MRNRSEQLQGNAAPLHLTGGKWAGVYFCSKCRLVSKGKDEAEECCLPRTCQECQGDIEDPGYRNHGLLYCLSCSRQISDAREQARWDAIVKVTPEEASEYVYIDGADGIESLDAAIDLMECGDADRVYCCDEQHLSLDAERVLENALDEWFEGVHDGISRAARKQLQELLDGWCDAQQISQWVQNDQKGIVLR